MASPMEVPVIVEQYDEDYLAYNDDVRVTASGASEQEALRNFAAALRDLVEAFGREALRGVRPLVTRSVTVERGQPTGAAPARGFKVGKLLRQAGITEDEFWAWRSSGRR